MKKIWKYGRTTLVVLGVLLVFAISYLIVSSILNKNENRYAPDICGVTADKKSYSLSDNLNKTGTLLIFFDCDTPKAVELMQSISKLAPSYNVDVMAVSTGEGTIEEQIALMKEKEITVFPHTLFDVDGEMAKTYNIKETPITYFIDKTGRICDAYVASISEKSLKKELAGID